MFDEVISTFTFAILTALLSTVIVWFISYFDHYIPFFSGIPVWGMFLIVFLLLMLLQQFGLPLKGLYAWIFRKIADFTDPKIIVDIARTQIQMVIS